MNSGKIGYLCTRARFYWWHRTSIGFKSEEQESTLNIENYFQ